LGVQVVIEDYVHGHGLKVGALLASTFAHVLLGVAGLFAILKVAVAS
jgi:succinate dehydrogenase / fumarate reductase membrane anchor subunit